LKKNVDGNHAVTYGQTDRQRKKTERQTDRQTDREITGSSASGRTGIIQ